MKHIPLTTLTFLIFLCILFYSCKPNSKQTPETAIIPEINENPYQDAEMKAVIIPSEKNTFGYDIYVYDAILIHQPSRPGVSGNLGFATEEDALKVAELVIIKMRNNEMPPTITMQELQELGVLK